MDERAVQQARGTDALTTFVATTRRWTAVQVDLAPEVSSVCRSVAVADLAVGGWAMVVLGMRWPCTGLLCAGTTLGGRPALLLVWTTACVLATCLLSPATDGLTRVGGAQLAVLTLTTALGAVAALGAVLLLVLAVLAVAAAVDAVLTVIELI